MKIFQLSIRTTLLVIIGSLNVLIAALVGSSVYHSWNKFQESQVMARGSVSINNLYTANKFLSLERAASLSILYVEDDTTEILKEDIDRDRKKIDDSLNQALTQIAERSPNAEIVLLANQVKEKFEILQKLRVELDENLARPRDERDTEFPDLFFGGNTDLILAIRDLITGYERHFRMIDAAVGQQMMFKYFVWEITEYAGREYAVIGRLIAENKLADPESQKNLLTWRNLIQHGWETTHQFIAGSGLDEKLNPYMKEAEVHYFMVFDQTKDILYTSETLFEEPQYPLSIEMWLELASQAVDSLLALKDAALQETQNYVNDMERNARQDIALNIFLFVCALSISLYCLAIIILRVIRPVNDMVDALYVVAQEGPNDILPVSSNSDEIGKLQNVLKVFQENTRKIKQSNEELERYAYITAHDLKSPLRAIDNLSLWIEEDLGEALSGKSKEHMDLLRKRVRRMEKLLDDTLQYSRIDKQLRPEDMEIINCRNLVEDAIALAAPPEGFTIKIADGFSTINIARLPLQQVFYNLINNAIKHNDDGKGTIEIGVREEADKYKFSVKDDGPGIPKQYHEKVFEMFQTLKTRDQREGSGMGLAFIKKILTTCGGSITLESEPGQGCLFCFTWPKPDKEKNNA